MKSIKIGSKLVHPHHGTMTVTHIDNREAEEYIESEWRRGRMIHAEFDRFIPGVKWRTGGGVNLRSKLVFHEFYLSKLELEG